MTTRRWIAATAVAALSVVLLAPASLGDTSRFKAQGCANDPHWEPGARQITTGDKIAWKNPTQCDHTVTAYSGRWSKNTVLSPDESTGKRFRKAGTFKFRCMITGHSAVDGGKCTGMCGRVRVTR
jgi:plastocyanin